METGRVSISFFLSNIFIFKRNDLPYIRPQGFIAIVNLTLDLFQFIPKSETVMTCLLLVKKFKVNNWINWGATSYFHLTQPWLLRITYQLSGKKIVDGDWPEGDNRELRIWILLKGQMQSCYNMWIIEIFSHNFRIHNKYWPSGDMQNQGHWLVIASHSK